MEGGQVWFQPSKVWGMDRVVYYEDGQELVPLLPEEVPFGYDSDQIVFLWDRDSGVAAATSRVAAWAVTREVPEGPSAVALFGECPEENGYTHDLITDKGDECGPYPMVSELLEMGVTDVGSGCTMHEVAHGMYECRDEAGGKQLAELAGHDVIGGLPVAGGFVPGGITPKAFTATTNMKMFTRLCVVGSEAVDFSAQPVEERLTGVLSRADLRWFGKRDCGGKVANVGMVTVGEARNLSACVEVKVDESVKRLYYLDAQSGEWCTKAVDVVDGMVMLRVTSKLCGMYVYALTDTPLSGTSEQPVKFVTPFLQFGAVKVLVPEHVEEACYRVLLVRDLEGSPSTADWSTLIAADMVPAEELDGYSLVRTGYDSWHVTCGAGLPVSRVVAALRVARKKGHAGATVDGQRVALRDFVGAVSRMTEVLAKQLVTLVGIGLEELDEKGGRVCGQSIALLGAADKTRSRVLQAVGDNALSLALSIRVLDSGGSAQEYQELRSVVSNNAFLAGKFGPSVFYTVFQDVGSTLSPKTGGGAVEALVGTVFIVRGMPAVQELMKILGI